MKAPLILKSTAMLLCVVYLASCNALPASGPNRKAIEAGATEKLNGGNKSVGIEYAFLDVTKQILPYFDTPVINSLEKGFGGGRGSAPEVSLGPGDVVEVSIFESQSGGLFIPAEAGSRPGNYITLPKQTVDRSGMINVPYAGAVKASGRSVTAVQADIQKRLASRAIEPQVIITTTLNRSNNVSILGDVNQPAQLDLSPSGERVLDVISRAGGINAPGYETYVTIERNGKQATVLFRTLIDRPQENIYVRPGDTVFVNRERRTYLAFGASGLNGRLDFEDSNLTLGEALAKAGGPIDNRADPSEVFLYREVDRKTLAQAGVNVSRFIGATIPTVFKADLRDPGIFFAVQQFKMQDKDIIYISNSSSTELTKFLNLINNVSGTSANVPANALTTRNSMRRLGNNN